MEAAWYRTFDLAPGGLSGGGGPCGERGPERGEGGGEEPEHRPSIPPRSQAVPLRVRTALHGALPSKPSVLWTAKRRGVLQPVRTSKTWRKPPSPSSKNLLHGGTWCVAIGAGHDRTGYAFLYGLDAAQQAVGLAL